MIRIGAMKLSPKTAYHLKSSPQLKETGSTLTFTGIEDLMVGKNKR